MIGPRDLGDGVILRVLERSDAAPLAAAYLANREHLAPWEPVRPEDFFTVDGQRESLAQLLAAAADGTGAPLVLVDGDTVVGRLTVSSIVRGAFQSAHLGYWMARDRQGAGLMTRAVGAAVEIARDELGLHRLEAGTLVHNEASQRVLLRNGFELYGTAARYLRIAGHWQDHRLFQRILRDD